MRRYHVEVAGTAHVVDVQQVTGRQFRVVVGGQHLDVTLSLSEEIPRTVIAPGISPVTDATQPPAAQPLSAAKFKPVAPESLAPMVPASLPPLTAAPEPGMAANAVKAPMPGSITAVDTKPGAAVKVGQVLLKLEAMKMVNAIKSPRDGVVSEVRVQAGQTVSHGQVLVTFKEA